MKDTLISYSTAKLAHDKGFKIRCPNMFDRNKEIQTTPSIKQILSEGGTYKDIKTPIQIFAPTQSLLQKWLREIHNIHINIQHDYDTKVPGEDWNEGYIAYVEDIIEGHLLDMYPSPGEDDFLYYNTYEEALEKGLYEALKLIKNELEKK